MKRQQMKEKIEQLENENERLRNKVKRTRLEALDLVNNFIIDVSCSFDLYLTEARDGSYNYKTDREQLLLERLRSIDQAMKHEKQQRLNKIKRLRKLA